mmetsp:Transcript_25845/g.30460  ORF Transcript_25845/g.30460 Transcript_25845/m.30460 type:complete len:91 (-) Transcript_25845:106-378(-)
MPVGYVFVGDTGCHIKHDNGALPLNIVPVAESAEFFLAGGVPNVELDGAAVGVEEEGVHFDSEGCYILLFEFSGEMAFDEGCFADSAVAY